MVEIENEVRMIPLKEIVSNTAQSRGMGVLSNLTALGWGMFVKGDTGQDSVWNLLTSDAPEERKFAISLLEGHEPGICRLAESLIVRQLQSIGVRPVKDDKFDILYGARRAFGVAYNHAKKPSSPDVIEAKIFTEKMSAVDAKIMALDENDDREDESPIDRAMTYDWLKKEGKLKLEKIADRVGQSLQNIKNYLNLLNPLLEDKRMAIHTREMSIERALKLLRARRDNKDAEEVRSKKKGRKSGTNEEIEEGRYRLPGIKKVLKIYESTKKPKNMDEDEWELWISTDVRKWLALKCGFKYTPFKGQSTSVEKNGDGKEKTGKTLTVSRKRAQLLLISLGKTNARTFTDEVLQEKLENIVNLVEPGQKSEDKSLQGLLDRLVAGYKDGLTVKVVAEVKKK